MVKDEEIQKQILEIVKKIAASYKPLKIILFGSYAYGDPTEDSDLDILIVTEGRLSPEGTYKIQREFSREFSIPLQLTCVSDEEFSDTKDIIGGITYPASKYGEILYEKS